MEEGGRWRRGVDGERGSPSCHSTTELFLNCCNIRLLLVVCRSSPYRVSYLAWLCVSYLAWLCIVPRIIVCPSSPYRVP